MSAAVSQAARLALLGGIATGLALAPALGRAPVAHPALLALPSLVALLARPRQGTRGAVPWLAVLTLAGALAGAALGSARLEALDARAFHATPGEELVLRGTIASPPRPFGEATRFALETDAGRIAIEAPMTPHALDEGGRASVAGPVRELADWERGAMERLGASRVLEARDVTALPGHRGGLRGTLDGIRRRAEEALGQGTPGVSASLLRGFVLGQDEAIAEPVREDFRRSGLAHILAVSGQNVMLLALLAAPFLALAGVPLRLRLLAICALIAIYVPVAGAGPSIQRAGVMGVAGLVAALASRPRSRWYALLLAAAVTLALDPRASADVGWQLSFAAVFGLLVLTNPIVSVLTGRMRPVGAARRALAEGAAMTIAATLATGPLVAHHFGVVSLTSVPANLLALPAVAPAMWLGMLAGALGQLPGAPVEPLTWLGGFFAGWIGWVSHALGGGSAQIDVSEPGVLASLVWTPCLVAAARLACLAVERRTGMRPSPHLRRPRLQAALALSALAGLLAVAWLGASRAPDSIRPAPSSLVMRFLDVGQGDAILLEPRGRDPILIDTGPPGSGAADRLSELGVERLDAVVITHDERDHSGALPEVLAAATVERLIAAQNAPQLCLRMLCPPVTLAAAGDEVRSGPLRLRVLWPHAGFDSPDEPNAGSLVIEARAGPFEALLTGDAESELAAFPAPRAELLKVAHHGSADPGLPALLRRVQPELAVISVGENSYGHPAGETMADLAEAGIPVLRTDEASEVVVHSGPLRWTVE